MEPSSWGNSAVGRIDPDFINDLDDAEEGLLLSDDDLCWSGELILSSRRSKPDGVDLGPGDDEEDEEVAWDQLELDPDPAGYSSPPPSPDDNDGPPASASTSLPAPSRQDQDEHSLWLRETNAFLQEAMVYLVGSIALKTQKDERRALQCFRKAHELGHARGTFRVGLAHLEGTGGVEKGEELAKTYLRESLDQFVSHQMKDSDFYGNFKQYLENDFRNGALHHPLVLDLLQLYAEQSEDIKKIVDFALERNSVRQRRNITINGSLPIFQQKRNSSSTSSSSNVGSSAPGLASQFDGESPACVVALAADVSSSVPKRKYKETETETKTRKEKKEKKKAAKGTKKEGKGGGSSIRQRGGSDAGHTSGKQLSGEERTAAKQRKKEKKRQEREEKRREKERRREDKKLKKMAEEAVRRTKSDDRKALSKSKKAAVAS